MAGARKRPDAEQGKRQMVAVKMLPDELADIDARAHALNMTRTDYMLRTALRQPLGDEGFDERLEDVERRLGRLEEIAFTAA